MLRFFYKLLVKCLPIKKDNLLINSAQDTETLKELESEGYLMNGITVYFFLKEFKPKE